ncbi:major capsid protein [Nonomuraea sp. 10N515B]|uniref:major capsid protein n=1 Tax=Nonomuraea sp. 10N515B TaxID=3457422 RepID=UPI003FCE1D10
MEFELPEDITALGDDELAQPLDGAVAAFDAKSNASAVTSDDLAQLRQLATAVNDIRTEQATRREAAEAAAAEIDALAAQVRGDDSEPEAEPDAPEEPEAVTEPEPEPAKQEPIAASAAGARRPALDLSSVRRRQPRVLPPDPNPKPEITASVDVPGYQPGQPLDMEGVTEGIIRRANALKTAGGGVGLCASYRLPFDRSLIVNDSSSGTEGTRAVILAADQSRLPNKDIVASGGWCAPSETVYELADIACPEMLWDAPEIQLARGGLRFFPIPSLDVGAMTWVHTEADDISGATKPCFKIPCPEPEEVRCDAVGVCLEAGILTQRHFPELVVWYQRNTMVAHELRVRQVLFDQAVAAATPVTIAQTFGAFSAIYAAVALQAADMVERHSLCDRIGIEVVFPWWSRHMFLADVARRNGVSCDEIDVSCTINAFATLGDLVVGGVISAGRVGERDGGQGARRASGHQRNDGHDGARFGPEPVDDGRGGGEAGHGQGSSTGNLCHARQRIAPRRPSIRTLDADFTHHHANHTATRTIPSEVVGFSSMKRRSCRFR